MPTPRDLWLSTFGNDGQRKAQFAQLLKTYGYVPYGGDVPVSELTCVFDGCDEPAFGLIVVNDNKSKISMTFLPMCNDHGQQAKSRSVTICIHPGEVADPVTVSFNLPDIPRPESDVTLSYEVVG